MKCKPVHIHLKPDDKPHAKHVPIPIPVQLRDQVKADLDKDVKSGDISVSEPVTWYSSMVVTADIIHTAPQSWLAKVECTVFRETHHCEPPLKLVMQVQAESLKKVIDLNDGYHSISIDEERSNLTTFITPFGRYKHLYVRGYVATGDAYTRYYDNVIKEII